MLRHILSLFGLGLLISPSFLHADTITTFALDGFTFQTPATLTGTITIDVTTGNALSMNVAYTAGSLTYDFSVPWGDLTSCSGPYRRRSDSPATAASHPNSHAAR